MFSPILEFEDNMTRFKHCGECNVPLHKMDSRETFSYYIGDHHVEVIANIQKGECPRCGMKWEMPDASQRLTDAFRLAIDEFWKKHLDEIGVSDEEMASVMFVVSRLMMKLGPDKQRQVAAEMGRWLGGCVFI